MEKRIASLETNFSILTKELNAFKDLIVTGFTKVDTNFSNIDKRLSSLEKTVKELSFKVANLDTNTSTGLNDVGTKIESLTEEIQKIGVVTNYGQVFENQKGLN